MDDPVVILRMLERIIAVIISGLSIYFGYRLFFHLPFERGHEGQLELPGVKIVLSRVGPGVFFAAFGTVVLFYSLTTPINVKDMIINVGPEQLELTRVEADKRSIIHSKEFTGFSGLGASGTSVTPQQRSKALTSIEMLNCAQRLLPDDVTSPDLKDQISLAIRDAKRVLMLSVWSEDDWGRAEQLEVTGPSNDSPIQLRTMFNTTYEDCPK